MSMNNLRLFLAILASPVLTLGCATTLPKRTMNYDECESSEVCVVRGLATARVGEHAPIVKLDLADGRCINVSLPRQRWDELRQNGPTETTVEGRVYLEPTGPNGEEEIIEINGRRIGYGLCGRFFVYVPDGQ